MPESTSEAVDIPLSSVGRILEAVDHVTDLFGKE